MKSSIVIFAFIGCLILSGCDAPNPTPEVIDPVYLDIQKFIDEFKKKADEEEKALDATKLEVEQAKPQSGQILRAQKKLSEVSSRLTQLRQNQKYWMVKLESRRLEDRDTYIKAWYKKEKWPNPTEYKDFVEKMKTGQPPKGWDTKARMSAAGVGPKDVKAAATKSAKGGHDSHGDEHGSEPEHH